MVDINCNNNNRNDNNNNNNNKKQQQTTTKMAKFAPKIEIGYHFLHVPNNFPPRNLIYTSMGYLPNDLRAEKKAWKNGFHCNSGMKNCMTAKQFSIWWASQIEKKYKQHLENKGGNLGSLPNPPELS